MAPMIPHCSSWLPLAPPTPGQSKPNRFVRILPFSVHGASVGLSRLIRNRQTIYPEVPVC